MKQRKKMRSSVPKRMWTECRGKFQNSIRCQSVCLVLHWKCTASGCSILESTQIQVTIARFLQCNCKKKITIPVWPSRHLESYRQRASPFHSREIQSTRIILPQLHYLPKANRLPIFLYYSNKLQQTNKSLKKTATLRRQNSVRRVTFPAGVVS